MRSSAGCESLVASADLGGRALRGRAETFLFQVIKQRWHQRGIPPKDRGSNHAAQPLTDPATSPSTIQRWMNMYKATTGIVVITDAAMSSPQWNTSP